MTDLQVGDRVEIVSPVYSFDFVGAYGTVRVAPDNNSDFPLVQVEVDGQENPYGVDPGWNYSPDEVRKVRAR